MGAFYVNYTIRGPKQQAVAAALAGRNAIVAPEQDGYVVAYDEESDKQDMNVISELAMRLSDVLQCPLLAVLNHDDDILWYQLYRNGQLVDAYNSAPGYFETQDEEAAMAGPEGGDAQTLCDTFGSQAVAKIEAILRKPGLLEGGYTFQNERHQDLVHTLGLPDCSVCLGFEHISEGEWHDDLQGKDLLYTRDLDTARSLDKTPPKPIPGYYKVSFRSNPKLKKSIPVSWMPGPWTELECPERDLSEAFRGAIAPQRQKFERLGFAVAGFRKNTRFLVPAVRETGGVILLDQSRRYCGQLVYNRHYIPATRSEKEQVHIVFTAVFPDKLVSCTNNLVIADDRPNHTVLRIESNDADLLYQKFIEELKRHSGEPIPFADFQALKDWSDAQQFELFADKVRRGHWVRMSDYEVAQFQKQKR